MNVTTHTLIKTVPRKNRIGRPKFMFDQDNQITLNEPIESKRFEQIVIHGKQFLCVVPLYDFDYIFRVTNSLNKNFTLSDIINEIIELTIHLYQFDINLNPQNYNCRQSVYECACDVAQGYVLSAIYIRKNKLIWFDCDH